MRVSALPPKADILGRHEIGLLLTLAEIDPLLPNLLPRPVLARLAVGEEIVADYPLCIVTFMGLGL